MALASVEESSKKLEAKYKNEQSAPYVPKTKALEHVIYQLWDEEDEEEAAEQKEREIMKKALQRSKEKRPSLYGSGTKVKRRSRNN